MPLKPNVNRLSFSSLEFLHKTALANLFHQTLFHEVFGIRAARLGRRQGVDDILNAARVRRGKITKRFRQPLIKRSNFGFGVGVAQDRPSRLRLGL